MCSPKRSGHSKSDVININPVRKMVTVVNLMVANLAKHPRTFSVSVGLKVSEIAFVRIATVFTINQLRDRAIGHAPRRGSQRCSAGCRDRAGHHSRVRLIPQPAWNCLANQLIQLGFDFRPVTAWSSSNMECSTATIRLRISSRARSLTIVSSG